MENLSKPGSYRLCPYCSPGQIFVSFNYYVFSDTPTSFFISPLLIPTSRMFISTAYHSSDSFTSDTILSSSISRSSFTLISGLSNRVSFIYCNKLINSLEPFLLAIFKKIFVVPSSRCNPVISSHHHAYYFPFPY